MKTSEFRRLLSGSANAGPRFIWGPTRPLTYVDLSSYDLEAMPTLAKRYSKKSVRHDFYGVLTVPSTGDPCEAVAQEHDDYFWPHKGGCPLCGSDAYVGFSSVDCSSRGCRNFVYRKGM